MRPPKQVRRPRILFGSEYYLKLFDGYFIRLVADKNIPYIQGLLDPYATIKYLEPEEVTPALLRETDGMIIRTRKI